LNNKGSSLTSPGNVSSLWIVHIRDSAIEFIRYERQWIRIEAFLGGNFPVLNGTSVHLEMPLVMSRDLRLDINDGSRGIALLDDGGHNATDGIGRKIVVVIAHFAANRNARPANVQT
jgi:hypothetical protein